MYLKCRKRDSIWTEVWRNALFANGNINVYWFSWKTWVKHTRHYLYTLKGIRFVAFRSYTMMVSHWKTYEHRYLILFFFCILFILFSKKYTINSNLSNGNVLYYYNSVFVSHFIFPFHFLCQSEQAVRYLHICDKTVHFFFSFLSSIK